MKVIDARGRSCPEPVLMTKAAAKDEQCFQIIVDNTTAFENIKRFCSNAKLSVSDAPEGEDFRLTIKK